MTLWWWVAVGLKRRGCDEVWLWSKVQALCLWIIFILRVLYSKNCCASRYSNTPAKGKAALYYVIVRATAVDMLLPHASDPELANAQIKWKRQYWLQQRTLVNLPFCFPRKISQKDSLLSISDNMINFNKRLIFLWADGCLMMKSLQNSTKLPWGEQWKSAEGSYCSYTATSWNHRTDGRTGS